MEEQNGRSVRVALVDIVLARLVAIAKVHFEPILGKGVIGNIGEAVRRCLKDLHADLPMVARVSTDPVPLAIPVSLCNP